MGNYLHGFSVVKFKLQFVKQKKRYFQSRLNGLVESRPIWDVINELTGRNLTKSLPILSLKIDDIVVSDSAIISDSLANSFIVPDSTTQFNRQLFEISLQDIDKSRDVTPEIPLVTESEILSAVKNYKFRNKWGEFPASFLKITFPALVIPLTFLFSSIFISGTVPRCFKNAIIKPLYKNKGSKMDPHNYRPISLLPPLSKIFEKICKSRLNHEVNTSGKLHDEQHGFRNRRSCITALTIFSQDIAEALDEGEMVLVVFVDLKKAFDYVIINILLVSLRDIYKISTYLLRTFGSYFCDRTFSISINSFKSRTYLVN